MSNRRNFVTNLYLLILSIANIAWSWFEWRCLYRWQCEAAHQVNWRQLTNFNFSFAWIQKRDWVSPPRHRNDGQQPADTQWREHQGGEPTDCHQFRSPLEPNLSTKKWKWAHAAPTHWTQEGKGTHAATNNASITENCSSRGTSGPLILFNG